MLIREGFPGQRLRVLPGPLVEAARARPVTRQLLVTDAGYFPRAARHGRARRRGSAQTVLILCMQGTGWVVADQVRLEVRAGEALVLPAGLPHAYGAAEAEPWTIWFLHAVGTAVDDFTTVICGGQDRAAVVPARDAYSIAAQLEAATEAVERDETEASLVSPSGAAWKAFALVAADRQRGPARTADRIAMVQAYLREDLGARRSVRELAQMTGLSTSHFSALFKESAGIGVVEYSRRLRVARARELLLTTDSTVTSIAAHLGYQDAFYFTRQFTAIDGISPTEFRRRAGHDRL